MHPCRTVPPLAHRPCPRHALRAVTEPAEHARHVRDRYPGTALSSTDGVVLLYQQDVPEKTVNRYPCRRVHWVRGELFILKRRDRQVAVCGGFGLGAPATVLVLEQLIALGARRAVTVGTAATLRADLSTGQLVVCDNALRNEGVSRHYLPPGSHIKASQQLTYALTASLRAREVDARSGPSWTTDALHRGIDTAAVFAVADSLVERRPRREQPEVASASASASASGEAWDPVSACHRP